MGRPEYRKPLATADEDGVAKKLLGHSTSLLRVGLDALDTPGAIVRGGIGKVIGAQASGDRTSGRDLLDHVGITRSGDDSWLASGLGLGAELLTDPLTYLTGGTHSAATKTGAALAKTGATAGWSRKALLQGFHGTESALLKAGQTPEAIAHLRNSGQRIASPADEAAALAAGAPIVPKQALAGLAGFGSPFAKTPSIVFGAGGKIPEAVAGGIDKAADFLQHGNPIGRWGTGLFNHAAREATGAASQRAMIRYGTPAIEAARRQAREDTYKVVSSLDRGLKSGLPEEDLLRYSRQAGEGQPLRAPDPKGSVNIGVAPVAHEAGLLARSPEARQLDEARRFGLPLPASNDQFVDYMPRQSVDLDSAREVAAGRTPTRQGNSPQVFDRNNVPLVSGANFKREDAFRDVPGGTTLIDDLVKQYAGNTGKLSRLDIERSARRQMAFALLAQRGPAAFAGPAGHAIGHELDAKARLLAAHLVRLSPDYAKAKIGLYSPNIAADVARSGEQHARTIGSAEMAMGFIGDNARPRSQLGKDAVPISRVIAGRKPNERLGFITRMSDPLAGTPNEGALVEAYKRLAKQGAGPADALIAGPFGDLRRAVDQFALPRKLYEELIQNHGRWSTPEVVKEPLGLFRGLTSTFKNLAYPLWPASHVRNAFSAGINNLAAGTGFRDYATQFNLMRNRATSAELAAAGLLPPGSKLTDEQARDLVRQQQFATGKLYDGHAGQFDLDEAIAAKLQSKAPGRITPDLWGADRSPSPSFARDASALVGGGIKDQAKAFYDKLRHPLSAPNPLEMASVFGGKTDFPALATGRSVGANIEDFFRGANWLGHRRAGVAPDVAGRLTRDLHFDYDQLTKFEKTWARQLVPFYTFSRKNLASQARQLVAHPGQTVTQMRLMGAGRDQNDYVPDYLASGTAIPTGPEVDGQRQFISSLGTPLEEGLGRFWFKNGLPDAKRTAQAFASSLNPLIKGPLEQLSGVQFHTGRPLEELRPSSTASALGRLVGDDNPQLLSQILSNTPITRFLSTVDKLGSDRIGAIPKALSLATGLNLADVNVGAARAGEARRAVQDQLAQSPRMRSHLGYSVRPGEEANLTPAEVELLRADATLREAAMERAKAEKKTSVMRIGIAPR